LRDANDLAPVVHIHWSLRNSGPGMAVVHTMRTRTLIGVSSPLGVRIVRSREKINWGSIVESKDTAPGFSITTPELQRRVAEIRAGATQLYFVIQLDGQNIFRDHFSVLFSFQYSSARKGFMRAGTTPDSQIDNDEYDIADYVGPAGQGS
jgi:hypothetical protein